MRNLWLLIPVVAIGIGAVACSSSSSSGTGGGGDFALSISPASQTVVHGGTTGNYTVTITPSGGFTGSVTLTAAALNSGATVTITGSPATTTATFTVTTLAAEGAGSQTITVTGVSGGLSHTATATVTVTTTLTFYNFTVGSQADWPHNNAGVRVIQTNAGISRSVAWCTNSATAGAWSVTSAGLLAGGANFNIEVWGDAAGGAPNYVSGDHTWYFQITGAAANYNNVFSHNGTAQLPISWKSNKPCPGD